MSMVRIGNFLFHYRNGIFPVAFLILVLVGQPSFLFGSKGWDMTLDIIGLLVSLAGQVLRMVTIGFDYIRRGGVNRKIHADRLVTGGMFSHSRNPLYLGNLLMFIGLTMVINSPVIYLIGIPLAFFVYAAIIAAEEDFLRKKFGQDYIDYCNKVNRLWPNLKGFSHSIAEMEFNWKRVLVKEYNTTFAWLLTALALIYWQNQALLDSAQAALYNQWIPATFAGLLVLYFIIWRLKKTGRLRAD